MAGRFTTTRRVVPLIVAVLALAFLIGCGGQGTGAGPVALDYNFTEGESHTYDVSVTMDGQIVGDDTMAELAAAPTSGSMDARVALEVVDVDDEGVATIEARIENVSVQSDGEAMPLPQDFSGETQTFKVDADGNLLSADGTEPEQGMEGLPEGFDMSALPFDPAEFAPQTDFMFPEGGVAEEGDTWKTETTYPIPFLDQEVVATTSGTLTKVEERDGQEVADLEFSGELPLDLSVDFGQILSGMGLDQMMGGLQSGSLDGLEGLEGMEGMESIEGMEGFQFEMPQFTMLMSGTQTIDGTASIYTASGFPAAMQADAVIDLTIDFADVPEDQAAELPAQPVTIDFTINMEMNEVS